MTPASPLQPHSTDPRTLVELLEQQAERHGERVAVRFVYGEQREEELSYGELRRRARAVAAGLAGRVEPGDRALLVFPPGLEFIGAFFGCLYAGVVAVPSTYPKPRRPMPRMSGIARDSGAAVALTTEAALSAIDFRQQEGAARSLDWLAIDSLHRADPAAGWSPHAATGGELAFLQYTSGSTSEPKGVMLSHANVLANLRAIRGAFGLPTTTAPASAGDPERYAGVFWLPAYHDMGLIGGVLTPLSLGGPSILMPPPAFLQRPLRWLEAIDRFGATISGGPDFAFRLCVERTTAAERASLDLSRWRLAFCGAEPVRAQTLASFARAMAPAGFNADAFYPCYGLAEATLLAAGPDFRRPPTVRGFDRGALGRGEAVASTPGGAEQRLVSSGVAPAGHGLAIADPRTLAPLPEGRVGEVIVAGPSVARGYWGRPGATAEAFLPADAGDATPRLRTGDLGFLFDGELFVTGRRKDLIILRGRNHYPQDIEQTAAESHPGVQAGAAFAATIDPGAGGEGRLGGEQLVVVHQVDRGCGESAWPAVTGAIRDAVLACHEVEPAAVVLIRTGSLPVTSSGKVQRGECRDRWLAGELKTLHEWRARPSAVRPAGGAPPAPPGLAGLPLGVAAERIEEWMLAWLITRAELEASRVDRNRPFAEQGLDSLTAVELSGELEEAFGVPLPPVVAWNYPTPAAMARYLAEKSLAAGRAGGGAGDGQLESLLADIEGMTDEEASRTLADES